MRFEDATAWNTADRSIGFQSHYHVIRGEDVMSETRQPPSDKDAELEQEIRADRKFSLAEAIGRIAGPGMMEGGSPASPKHQAEAPIEHALRPPLTAPLALLLP